MPRKCATCEHEQRRAINRALVRGSESDGDIAKRFGLTKSSILRHRRNHLRPYLAELIAEDPELAELDPLAEIRALYYRIQRYLNEAEDAQDWPAIRYFHQEARKDLEVLAKILGEIDERPVVHVLIAPEVRHAIVGALQDYPEARLAVVNAILELEAAAG